MLLGVAQLVARDFWEVEVAGSSPVTQTIQKHWLMPVFLCDIINLSGIGAVGSAHAWGA